MIYKPNNLNKSQFNTYLPLDKYFQRLNKYNMIKFENSLSILLKIVNRVIIKRLKQIQTISPV